MPIRIANATKQPTLMLSRAKVVFQQKIRSCIERDILCYIFLIFLITTIQQLDTQNIRWMSSDATPVKKDNTNLQYMG